MPQKRYNDKMIGNGDQRGYHFANAGHPISPVIIKAASRAEAEKKLREMNEAGRSSEPPTIEALTESENENIL